MMWEYCRFCNLTGYCENQNMGRQCNSGVKKLYEENEALKKQLKIAKDTLRKYADEPEYYHDAVKALEQIKELDK